MTSSGRWIENGGFQKDISCSSARDNYARCYREEEQGDPCAYCWAKKEGVKFHETGKKAPESIIFRPVVKKQRVPEPDGARELYLGKSKIPIVERQRILGLNVATNFNKAELFSSKTAQKVYEVQAQDMIDKYGYFLETNIGTFRACAYRFQSLKERETPVKLSLAVSSYFVGKLRFCAAFYYLRSTQRQIDTVRFYYAMALSSILGLSVYETMGAACCKSMSVSEGNKSFDKLLRLTGQPSLRRIAMKDAWVFVRQCIEIEREWFLPENERLREKELEREVECKKKKAEYFPKFVAREMQGSLVEDCWLLARGHRVENSELDSAQRILSSPKRIKLKKGERVFEKFWKMAVLRVKEVSGGEVRSRLIRETFKVQVLSELEALEVSDRRYFHKTPSKQLETDKRCPVYPPDWSRSVMGTQPVLNFSCLKPAPQRYVGKIYRQCEKEGMYPCLICGKKNGS